MFGLSFFFLISNRHFGTVFFYFRLLCDKHHHMIARCRHFHLFSALAEKARPARKRRGGMGYCDALISHPRDLNMWRPPAPCFILNYPNVPFVSNFPAISASATTLPREHPRERLILPKTAPIIEQKNETAGSEKKESRGRTMAIKGSARNRDPVKKLNETTGTSKEPEVRPIPRSVEVHFPSPRGMSCSENYRYVAKNAIGGNPKTATR